MVNMQTFQRDVSFKICKALLHMNDYYICVRRFVVCDPELPDSLYCTFIINIFAVNMKQKYIFFLSMQLNLKISTQKCVKIGGRYFLL